MSKHAKHLETAFAIGDLVRLHLKLIEAGKERTQVFEGILISIKGRADQKMITVRKLTGGVGIERTVPLMSPWLVKVEVKKPASGKPRRAKLYTLRSKTT